MVLGPSWGSRLQILTLVNSAPPMLGWKKGRRGDSLVREEFIELWLPLFSSNISTVSNRAHMSKRTQIPLLVTTATATVLSKQNNLIFLKTMERKQYPVDQQVVQWLYMSFHSCLVIVFSLNINHTQIYTNISTNDREGVVSFAPRGQSVLDWKGELMQSAWLILCYKKQTTIYVPHLYVSLCEGSFFNVICVSHFLDRCWCFMLKGSRCTAGCTL